MTNQQLDAKIAKETYGWKIIEIDGEVRGIPPGFDYDVPVPPFTTDISVAVELLQYLYYPHGILRSIK